MASTLSRRASTSGLTAPERWLVGAAGFAGAAALALWSAAVLLEVPDTPGAAAEALALVSKLTEYGTESAAVALALLVVPAVRRLRAR